MDMQQCPGGLVCVDHPGTVDLSRLEPALKPLYPQLSDSELTATLKNYAVPGHDHFITDTNNFEPEWWDVRVVGVTSAKVYSKILRHGSASYILELVKESNPNVVGPIRSNLFLFFGVNEPAGDHDADHHHH